MKKIAIYTRTHNKDYSYLFPVIRLLEKNGYKILVEEVNYDFFKTKVPSDSPRETYSNYEDLPDDLELFITYGGDGTILRAATVIRDKGVPILGINAGRLGFLANVPKENGVSAIEKYIRGDFSIQSRSLLSVWRDNKPFPGELNFALNEVTLNKNINISMINVEVMIDNEFLGNFWADGLIISTPTGSTAYNLSCNGPILTPTSRNFIINSIAPHQLTFRPLVIPDESEIWLKPEGRGKEFILTLDSRVHSLPFGTKIKLKKSPFTMNFIQIEGYTFFRTLRQKLFWGHDNRNV